MTRQKTRIAWLAASAVLFPVTFYYLSPYIILMGASDGVVSGSFVVFGAMFLGALVFGRAFCGWLCPAGAIGEACIRLRNRRIRRRWVSCIKFAIWLPWVGMIAFLAAGAGGLTRIGFTYQTWHGISLASWQAASVFAVVVVIIVALALLVGRRGFCHTACWMAPFMILGRSIRDRLRLPGLRLVACSSECVACGACTRGCPMSLEVQAMVARDEMTATECILCARCADGCPKDVIELRFTRTA